MSITKCLSRKNSRALIKYLLDGKAHDQTLTAFRNLAVSGHNLMATKGIFNQQIVDKTYLWPFVANQFQATQQMSYAASKGRKKSIEAYHMIFSFSNAEFPLNGNQQKEAQQVVKLVGGYLNQRLPKDSQWIMAVQRDGRGHKLHAHVALNSVQVATGKTIQKQYVSWRDLVYQKDGQPVRQQGLASTFDDYLTKNFEKVTQRPYAPVKASRVNRVHSSEEQIIARGGYDWRQDLKDRITKAMDDPDVHDLASFEKFCAKQGVKVIRKRRGIGKDANGRKRYRLGYTYEFTGKDIYKSGNHKGQHRVHKMRDYRMNADGHLAKGVLGAAFSPEFIEKEIKNHEYITEQSINAEKQTGIRQDVPEEKYDTSANRETVAAIKQPDNQENETGNENDEPRIEPASATNESSKPTAEPEPDSSYSSSRKQGAFTAPRHLRKVDWSVFDPDADSDRRHRKAAEERAKRNAEFRRRAQAIAEYNRTIAGDAQRIKYNNHYARDWFKNSFAKLWHSLLDINLIAEFKRIFGLDAKSKRFDRVHREFNGNPQSNAERTRSDSQRTINNDGPDLF